MAYSRFLTPHILASLAIFGLASEGLTQEPPTFHPDIAPLFAVHCGDCHVSGGSAPFPLSTFTEIRKKSGTISKVIADGYMPPWLPDMPRGTYLNERGLTPDQIAKVQAWIAGGMPEGENLGETPPLTRKGWNHGEPDLIVGMPEPFLLPAEGPDIYQNFVIPEAIAGQSFIDALEFSPEASGAVHHAFVLFDERGDARKLDAATPEVGFSGMFVGENVHSPSSMFASWQPGRSAAVAPEGAPVPISSTSDVVIQLHLRPTGKPERIQVKVGFFLTNEPPSWQPVRLLLRALDFEIPVGAEHHEVESSYTLPVTVKVLEVSSHLHHRGKSVLAWAELPDGKSLDLLRIPKWDFDWQTSYRFAQPAILPAGSTLRIRYSFDNSENNAQNPTLPPIPVRYGLSSSDEMAEFWLIVDPVARSEGPSLWKHYSEVYALPDALKLAQALCRSDPRNATFRCALGMAWYANGDFEEAHRELLLAAGLSPDDAEPHKALASVYRRLNDPQRVNQSLLRAIALDPYDYQTRSNLGLLYLKAQQYQDAIKQLEVALRLAPTNPRIPPLLRKARLGQSQTQR